MTYRPYPNRDRALRMVDRHKFEEPPLAAPAVTSSQLTWHLTETAQAAAQALGASMAEVFAKMRQPQPGAYVLSTRRPGVVSPGS
ncbi:hypothetical protein [Streptomyces sp. SID8499]|uniref:hypothetical protein n=1 Tax=Streptomyces sp. SID8499 TaxID=2706106 RepID=UPI0013CD45D0|nr:hypothetical protein [Streptomyces sp. SID8499]NED31142.1 hypothetical protein [Streptomyces sp. SID8499]